MSSTAARGLLALSILSISASSTAWAGAQPSDSPPRQGSRDYLIKAAILYNFAKFVRWPDAAFQSADAPLRLCVLGGDPFGEALATIEGKRVDTHPLQIVPISEAKSASNCHLLFVGTSRHDYVEVLRSVADRPILTVGEAPGFARAGGVINLEVVDKRNQFDVNVGASRRAGLKLSAKLLRLARAVIGQ